MAYNFDAVQAQAVISTGLEISAYPSTLSAWAYANSDTIAMPVMSWIQAAGGHGFRILFAGQAAGDPVRFSMLNPFAKSSDKTSPGFIINNWHHVCFVCTSAILREVYVDAVAGPANTTSGTPASLSRVQIGLYSASQYFTGNISDVAIWSAALNTGEINSLAKGFSAKKIRPQSLEYYVPLVRDLYEYTNKPTLTNQSTATVTTHNRIYS